ncbi:MAG: hypothetical protein CMF96_08805 [Candidatus Marinimicrobia bacterium]|nr:hypothetical protein [Candidatus Neomarinimicrobiota bacterium]
MKNLLIALIINGFIIASVVSPKHFQYQNWINGGGKLSLNLDEIEFETHEAYKKVKYQYTGQLFEKGMPDLPTFSTLYRVDKDLEYNINYDIKNSYSIENIDIIPYFENEEKKQIMEGSKLSIIEYSKVTNYPASQIKVSEKQSFRDIDVISIEFVPFKYFPNERRLEVYDDVEITIVPESGIEDFSNIKYSRPFVKIYESLVPNFIRTEDIEFQQPSILFIGGGNSLDLAHVQNLIEWRHKQGYVTYTASTAQTGTSSNNIKNYIEDVYENFDPRPEFITLVGDAGGSYNIPAFTESWSGYSGNGDNPYGLLEGDDVYPDAIVGRISASSSSGMATVINKIIYYEKATFLPQTGTDWYERAALAGDPSSSGVSTIITNMYLNDIMDEYGVENVSSQYNSGWANFMSNKLNEGTLFLNYRGYIGVSGFGASQINNSNNGFMLPFATILTCGTGDYASSWGGEALSEAFFEAGSENSPKGAIASVGTATSGTHTMYNNIVNMGMYWGLFPGQAQTAGESLLHGKLHLIKTYPTNYNNYVNIFSHWNNLMGDPATHLWTDIPSEMNVLYNQNLSLGTNFVEVVVKDENNNPLEDAFVTLLMDDDVIFESKMTNMSGIAFFHLENIPSGDIDVTVIRRNYIPHEGTISVSDLFLAVNALSQEIIIYDDIGQFTSGNNDWNLNPGESVEIVIPFKNFGSSLESNLTIDITADNNLIEITNSFETIENINPNEELLLSFFLTLNDSAIDGEELGLRLTVTDSEINQTHSYLPIDVYGARLILNSYNYFSENILGPGESKLINIELENIGSESVPAVTGELISPLNTITVENSLFEWNEINSQSVVASNFIQISADVNIINGLVLPMQLHLTNNQGYDRFIPINLQIGEVTVADPLGPDQYGYYIYDYGDLGYNLAAIYDWHEIDPSYGGQGQNLNLINNGDGNPSLQQTTTVELPFTFTFYGIEYNQVSICANGWISFGESPMTSFRNYSIPSAGGPSPMVAAFWDDLKTSQGNVFTYHDLNNEFFVIQWSDMFTYNHNDENDFQIILYNTLTPTGDGEIKVQYKTFNNTSTPSNSGWAPSHGAYATIGIENHYGDDGLEYTFHNQYPETALPLGDETAIFISTRPSTPLLMGDIDQNGVLNIVDVVQIVNHILNPSLDLLTPTQKFVADLNEDSVVNVFDIIIIINIILD